MCGIIGCVGRAGETLDVLVHGLSKLEYRGYDSAGVALTGDRVDICKQSGKIEELREALEARTLSGAAGIGHTRWSTHGPPTDENAHPHVDCTGEVAVVHNGIIEKYQSLWDELMAAGPGFTSDTDTEVVPHLIEDAREEGVDPEAAFRRAIDQVKASYAIAAFFAGTDAIFAARYDSPLVLGVADGATFLASDIPDFRYFTDRVVYVADVEVVRLADDGWMVTDADGDPAEKSVKTVD